MSLGLLVIIAILVYTIAIPPDNGNVPCAQIESQKIIAFPSFAKVPKIAYREATWTQISRSFSSRTTSNTCG